MPSLPSVLANIPGYGGYAARRAQIEEGDSREIQQAGVLQQLHQRQQDAQEIQQMKGVVAQAGGDPARAVEALLKHGTPKSIDLASKLKALMPKPAEPYTLAPGGQRRGPDNALVAEAPFKPADDKGAWSEPYSLGGATVQKNTLTGEIRTAVSRPPAASENAAPVTPVTIADPQDPSSTIVIDGRTRQVLGKGPKLTQTGATDAKLVASMPQAKLRVGTMVQNIDKLDTALAELDADPGLSNITGTIMGRTPNVTNTATSAQAKLDSIKSQIFQSSLQSMREASKTGGAVGNVSDREGDKLERTIAALDQAQGTGSFKMQLKKARAQLKLSKELIQRAYDEQYGDIQATQAPQRRASDKPGAVLRFDAQGNPVQQ